MKALVTGAAGFIGSNVVRALLEAGHDVRALHQPTDDLRNLRGLDVERIAGDVTERSDVERATRGCDWVFHLAAIYALWTRDPARMRHVNVTGTRVVLEAARAAGVARVVHTSSIARFGGQGAGIRATEESEFALGKTGDLYSATKRDAHELARAFARDLDVTIVCPTGPIGAGDVGPTPTGRLLLACVTAPVMVVADTVSNFACVEDIARGHVLAAEKGRRGEAYLLGHRDLSLQALATMASSVLGRRRRVVVVPLQLANVAAYGATWWAGLSGRAPLLTPAAVAIAKLGLAADCGKAVAELGLPQTQIERGLEQAMEWFAREGYVRKRALAGSAASAGPVAEASRSMR